MVHGLSVPHAVDDAKPPRIVLRAGCDNNRFDTDWVERPSVPMDNRSCRAECEPPPPPPNRVLWLAQIRLWTTDHTKPPVFVGR